MAAALILRLLHHCPIVSIWGNSYRLRHHTDLYQTLTTSTQPAVPHHGDDQEALRAERQHLQPLRRIGESFDVIVTRRVSRDSLVSFEAAATAFRSSRSGAMSRCSGRTARRSFVPRVRRSRVIRGGR